MIILLDLNYTLVANSHEKHKPFALQIQHEVWRKNQATIKSFSGSFDGFWDETDTLGQGSLSAGATVTLNLYPEGDDSGATYWSGDVIITSISYNASFDGIVEASFSFTGTGALTESTVV